MPPAGPSRWTPTSIHEAISALPRQDVPHIRTLRRQISRDLKHVSGREVLDLALQTHERYVEASRFSHRVITCELISGHPEALALVGGPELERLGAGMSEWSHVDIFCTLVAGRAWREHQLPDATIEAWARSADRWWRRAALVATVPLNVRAQGGRGDAPRTLAVCALLLDDRDDTVVKALSWALRALAEREPEAARAFIEAHDARLAARVRREVRTKLETGVKNPRRPRPAGAVETLGA